MLTFTPTEKYIAAMTIALYNNEFFSTGDIMNPGSISIYDDFIWSYGNRCNTL